MANDEEQDGSELLHNLRGLCPVLARQRNIPKKWGKITFNMRGQRTQGQKPFTELSAFFGPETDIQR